MENKKSLIIIKPMSGPLQKLYEVLENIATEENIEILVSDDLNELSQLISMGGQYLTLTSDAKTCLTYLQENRAYIANVKSKTLLFTPKEIPQKVLDKFLKMGLSENVLDTLPPKTLLYKVKLLIKALKPNDIREAKKEPEEQLVKSMIDTSQVSTLEKNMIAAETAAKATPVATEDKKKRNIDLDIEPGMDYLSEAKKKRKAYKEESLDTKWSSKKPLSEGLEFEDASDENKEKKNSAVDEIDGFMRKKASTSLELEMNDGNEEDERKSKPASTMEEALERNKKEKKDFIEIEITNSKDKAPRKLEEEEESKSKDFKLKSVENTELEFDEATKKNKALEEEAEEQEKKKKERSNLQLVEEESEYKKKKADSLEEEDDESSNKKKRESVELEFAEEEAKLKSLKNQDAEEEEDELKKRKKQTELEMEEEDSNNKKAKTNEELVIEDELKNKKSKNTELEFDEEEETNKLKKLAENAEEEEAARNKLKSTELELEEAKAKAKKEKLELEFEEEENAKKLKMNLEEEEDEDKKKKAGLELEFNEEDDKDKKKRLGDLDLIDSDDLKKKEKQLEEEDSNEQKTGSMSLRLTDADDDDSKKAKALENEEEEELKRKSVKNIQMDFEDEKKTKKKMDNSNKIDSFMRGGKAQAPDQNWDDLGKKNSETTFELESKRKGTINIGKNDNRKNAGEITIDYRMLREEFNELGKSNYKPPEDSEKVQKIKEDDYDNGYKVIELKANGFDFAVSVINQFYDSKVKPQEILASVAKKMFNDEKGYCVFFTYQAFSKTHTENYNGLKELQPPFTDYWNQFKQDEANLSYLYSKSMSTWVCREVKEKDSFWSDTELPSWAQQELTSKVVEYIYPYYDGLDRMGMAYVYFPEGIRPQDEKKIIVLLELVRGIFLDTVQRTVSDDTPEKESKAEEIGGKVLNMFSGLFGKKKTG